MMIKKIVFLFALILSSISVFAGSTVHHKLSVTIDPAIHSLEVVDQITIPEDQVKSEINFVLNADLKITSETSGVTVGLENADVKAEDLGMDRKTLILQRNSNRINILSNSDRLITI
jgi:hypothetical protein